MLIWTHVAHSEVVVDKMFGDHMVLQQDLAVPIWGTATAGDPVTVSFAGQTKTVTTGNDGSWSVKLNPMKVGAAPDQMTVVSGESSVTFQDVLVGEVWLGSGQSNMAGIASRYAKNDPVLQSIVSSGPYPALRLYTRDGWKIANSETMGNFSAIHLSFGKALQERIGTPMGLMVGAVGGTPSGRWLSKPMIMANAPMMDQIKAAAGAASFDELNAANNKAQAAWKIQSDKAKASGKKAPRFRKPYQMADLYLKHVEPKIPYGIRGVLWDQGEGKTGLKGVDQVVTMRALISGWRKAWGQGDFYFLHVQKPSGGGAAWDGDNPVNKGAVPFLANLPEAHQTRPELLAYQLSHIAIGKIKNAPLVTAVDLQPSIHPANKSGYGKRASRVAVGTVYGQDIVTCGPTYRSHAIHGGEIRVTFDHTGSGLAFRHADSIRGFAICGSDRHWAWATAVIDGDAVLVSSPDVPNPVHVQYAFDKNSAFANLYNKDGLPALMFTTVNGK